MDHTTRILAIFTFVAVFQFDINSCQQSPEKDIGQGQDNDLRTMLTTLNEQVRGLTIQNNRLQQVWLGMQQMCQAISVSQSPGPETSQPAFQTRVLPLQVMFIKSDGADVDPTPISITYYATPDHTTEWDVYSERGAVWWTAGLMEQDYNDASVYTSTVEVSKLGTTSNIFFRLYNDDETVTIRLNVSAIKIKQEQHMTPPATDFLKINKSFVAHTDTDLIITGIVHKNFQEISRSGRLDTAFFGVNTSASPPVVFYIRPSELEGLTVNGSARTDSTANLIITIRYSIVQYGGLLMVSFPYPDLSSGMVQELNYGPLIKVYSPDGYIVQNNTIGMFPFARQTLLIPPRKSIFCFAMGNPRPEVAILELTKDGQEIEMTTETVNLDTYSNIKVMTISTNEPKQTEGRYICRATNGNQTIDAVTEVSLFIPAVFDDAKTGVTKNESELVVVSCTATGLPKPRLIVQDYYGQEIINSGMFTIYRSDSNNFTSRVTISFSPVDDPDIHSIKCLAVQDGAYEGYDVYRFINVFPVIWSYMD